MTLALARAAGAAEGDLTELDLDTLMNLEVTITSVSRRQERLADAAAAISVLTQEDIRRSGAKSMPEVLRLVPGLGISQLSSSTWQIGSRGFESMFSDKLLVLIDGRSIYTPTFSGVHWDTVDLVLEDIERIEVIRGPGASVWGANAVNGVINIVTRSAHETRGLLLSVAGGDALEQSTAARYGIPLGERAALRVYGKYEDFDGLERRSGAELDDEWNRRRGGFRLDWTVSPKSAATLQGDVQQARIPVGEGESVSANVLGRWTRSISETSAYSLQSYVAHVDRENMNGAERRDTFDLDFQHNFTWNGRHEIVWGLGFRHTSDDLREVPELSFAPARHDTQLFSGFAQGTFALVPEHLELTLGMKLEHNEFTGLELQPTVRLAWKPTEAQTLWSAISRAVRTPNRYDTGIMLGSPRVLYGNPDFESETVLAYELGYRMQPAQSLQIDLATFYNEYDDLKTATFFPPGTWNAASGENHGAELTMAWHPLPQWRLIGTLAHHRSHIHMPRGHFIPVRADTPENQLGLRSSLDLGRGWQFDVTGRYVGEWESQAVPSYVTADARLGWRPTPSLELSLVGQNLLDRRHSEVFSYLDFGAQVPRSVFARLVWRP